MHSGVRIDCHVIKSKAFCHDCAAIVETKFLRRNVPFNDGTGVAKNILSGVCDVCQRVVSIPRHYLADARKTVGSRASIGLQLNTSSRIQAKNRTMRSRIKRAASNPSSSGQPSL